CVPPATSVASVGLTETSTAGPGVVTTVVVEASPLALACTVLSQVPGTWPAVNAPPVEMVPPPRRIDQVALTGTEFPALSMPLAVNCTVAPTRTDGQTGCSTSCESAELETMTVARACSVPAVAAMAP